jgi:outer membrane protein TolC
MPPLAVAVWLFTARPAGAATLAEAIDAARAQNADLHLVHERTVQAESYRAQAWATLLPKAQVNATYNINQYPIELDFAAGLPPEFQALLGDLEPTVIQKQRYLGWNASVIQPLFSGEALPMLRGAYRNAEGARLSEQSAEQAIRAGVAQAYYGVLTAREAEQLSASALETARAAEETAARTVQAGLAAPRASLQAALSRSQAERDLRDAAARRVEAEQALARLTGLPADVPVALPPAPEVPPDLEAAVSRALSGRPDIGAAAAQADTARLAHAATWAGWIPDVNARFTYNWTENEGFAGRRDMWMLVFEGSWLAWDGGYRIAKAKETASQVRMAEWALTRQEQIAVEEVRVAWERYARAEAALNAMEDEVRLAEENHRAARDGFDAGTLTFLELQAAELQLRGSKLAQLVERMNRDVSAISLERAVGTW